MADTTRRLAGTAYFAVDGVTYMLAGDFSYSPASVKRETVVGMDGVHGYKETPVAGFVSATLRDAKDLTVADFNAMTNVTVFTELANGKTVIVRNGWTVDSQEVKSAEGTFDVRWESAQVEEA